MPNKAKKNLCVAIFEKVFIFGEKAILKRAFAGILVLLQPFWRLPGVPEI
jgi:hypothetical protein